MAIDLFDAAGRIVSSERFGLAAHIKKTAGSISFNIADEFARDSHADLARFLRYAKVSANELEAPLLLARNTGAIGAEVARLLDRVSEIRRMLAGLIKEVRRQAL